MRIAIYGLGYVGLTGAICLASEGHEVVGVDVSEDKVRRIMAGSSPIKEPGLDKMLADARAKGRLRCTTDAADPVRTVEIAIVCVGTPSAPDGAHNMRDIAEVTRQIASAAHSAGSSRADAIASSSRTSARAYSRRSSSPRASWERKRASSRSRKRRWPLAWPT